MVNKIHIWVVVINVYYHQMRYITLYLLLFRMLDKTRSIQNFHFKIFLISSGPYQIFTKEIVEEDCQSFVRICYVSKYRSFPSRITCANFVKSFVNWKTKLFCVLHIQSASSASQRQEHIFLPEEKFQSARTRILLALFSSSFRQREI